MAFFALQKDIDAVLSGSDLMTLDEFGDCFNIKTLGSKAEHFSRGGFSSKEKSWREVESDIREAASDTLLDGATWDVKYDDQSDYMKKYPEWRETAASVGYLKRDYPDAAIALFHKMIKKYPLFDRKIAETMGMPCEDSFADTFAAFSPEVTLLLKKDGDIGSQLWDVPHCECNHCRSDEEDTWPRFGVERLVVMRENGQVLDIIVVYEITASDVNNSSYDNAGAYRILLYVSNKTLGFQTLYYRGLTVNEGVEEFDRDKYDKIAEYVSKKAGIQFEDGVRLREQTFYWTGIHDRFVFPRLTTSKDNASVKSGVSILRDVYAPAYVSYNAGYAMSKLSNAAFKRLGAIASKLNHSQIGFLGNVPHKFFMTTGESVEVEADILPFIEDKEGVTIARFSSEMAEKVSTTGVMATLGAPVGIVKSVLAKKLMPNAVIHGLEHKDFYYGRRQISSRKRDAWEPADNTPFALQDVLEVRVGAILADTSDVGADGIPQVFWVQSEGTNWYVYDYSQAPPSYGKLEIKNAVAFGLIDLADLHKATEGFQLGYRSNNDYNDDGFVAVLRDAARENGDYIKTLYDKTALSMMNDMRVVWRLLTAIPSNKLTTKTATQARGWWGSKSNGDDEYII
jgi:hypothetical protein